MTTYTYLACDLRTNQILAELPLSTDSIGSKLNGYGELRATVNLGSKALRGVDLPTVLGGGGRTALYVDRDGVLVWGGIIWAGSRQRGTGQATIQALELESYLFRRFITANYQPTSVDQLTIARTLIQQMQTPYGGDIGILLGAETSGVLRSRDYFRTDLQSVGDALSDLTQLEHGFDMLITVAWEAGVPVKRLHLGSPRLGRTAAQSGFDFQAPGNITDWTDDWDAFDHSATDAWVLGAGQGTSIPIAHASDPTAIAAGWPILDRKNSEQRQVSQQTELDAHAREDLNASPIPVKTYQVQVKADDDPVFGSYLPGDDARFHLFDDDWYPTPSGGGAGFDDYLRITETQLNPQTERVGLTVSATP